MSRWHNLGATLRQGYITVRIYMKTAWPASVGELATQILTTALRASTAPLRMTAWRLNTVEQGSRYFLFFTGKVTGNTGAAGSGADFIRLDPGADRPRLDWVGHMSYAGQRVTPNLAANLGLLMGLKA
ncbi:hypothetical protein PR001_g27604 [Phytophthora rubi]|uniref:Uncharacterized protein n=1 Tax=Phytophthora rubi TaxID=129364 RepID=A0A6A3HK92_9STRA|nr:hypothetical protein PR001_g27604 [Phytophthora rubi]